MSLVDEVPSARALFNILNQTTQNPNGVIRKIPKTNEQTTRLWLCRSGESARKTKSRSPNNWGMQQTRAHLSQAVAPCGARSGDKVARRIVTCKELSVLNVLYFPRVVYLPLDRGIDRVGACPM